MTEEKIDCRGLACPQPVLKTRELLEKGEVARVCVEVDNLAARENVSRFLDRMGFQVTWEEKEGFFQVDGIKGEQCQDCEVMHFGEEDTHPKKSWSLWAQIAWGEVTMGSAPNSCSISWAHSRKWAGSCGASSLSMEG